MIWDSWRDFFAMGGYALYVWGSVVVVLVSIAGEVLELTWRRKAILADLSFTKIRFEKRPGSTHENPL